MAFPTIPTVAAGRVLSVLSTDTSGGTVTSPSLSSLTKNSGDLLIAICIVYDGNSTNAEFSSWGGGFTEFVDQATTTTMGIGAAYKWSTGSETGTFTVAVAGGAADSDAAFLLLSIPGAHATTPPEGGTIADGTSAAADPGSFNPAGWGAEDTLWIAVGGSGENSTTGSYTGVASAPTSYTSYADSGISADAVGGVEGAVAFRQLNAASEDVGAFSVDVSNARNSALIIAVRPIASQTATPSPATAAFAANAPTLVLGPLTRTPSAITAAWGVTAPTIVLGGITKTPSPVVAVWGAPAPTISQGVTATPSPVTAALSVSAPTLGQGFTATPSPVAVVWSVNAPTVQKGPVTLTPTPVTAAWSIPAPTTVKGPVTLTPSSIIATFGVFVPTLLTGGGGMMHAISTRVRNFRMWRGP